MKPIVKLSVFALASVMLSGCVLGPDYQRPDSSVPLEFRHTPGWKVAQPAELSSSVAWWSLYQDASLADLLKQLETRTKTCVRQKQRGVRRGRW